MSSANLTVLAFGVFAVVLVGLTWLNGRRSSNDDDTDPPTFI